MDRSRVVQTIMLVVLITLAGLCVYFLVIRPPGGGDGEHAVVVPPPPGGGGTDPRPEPAGEGSFEERTAGLHPDCVETLRTFQRLPDDPKKWCKEFKDPSVTVASDFDENRCGRKQIVEELASLVDCAEKDGTCKIYGGRLRTDLRSVVSVSGKYPFTLLFFQRGSAHVASADFDRLRRFVRRLLDEQHDSEILVFGSASPTAKRAEVDLDLADQRTDSAFAIVNTALADAGDLSIKVRPVSVGKDSLGIDYCAALPGSSEARAACEELDENSRRQMAFVLAYPTTCLQAKR